MSFLYEKRRRTGAMKCSPNFVQGTIDALTKIFGTVRSSDICNRLYPCLAQIHLQPSVSLFRPRCTPAARAGFEFILSRQRASNNADLNDVVVVLEEIVPRVSETEDRLTCVDATREEF